MTALFQGPYLSDPKAILALRRFGRRPEYEYNPH